jgi:ankyrin repeat protein
MPCWANFYEAASQFDPLNPEPLLEIINSGAHLDLPDRDGLTLLHYAAREGHYDAVRMLVEVGVKLEIQDREYVQRRVGPRPPFPLRCALTRRALALALLLS